MLLRLLMLAVLAASLSGCFGGPKRKCYKQQQYQEAKPGPRVRVPEGMQTLPPESRLPVPYGEVQSEPVAKGEPCLDEPPSYEDRAP